MTAILKNPTRERNGGLTVLRDLVSDKPSTRRETGAGAGKRATSISAVMRVVSIKASALLE